MYKLSFFVPESHLEEVKNALFESGAGRYKNYDMCSWEVQGDGQYRPLDGSRPWAGESGKLEKISEYRVEMICSEDAIREVIKTLLNIHPYEEPAYDVLKLESII